MEGSGESVGGVRRVVYCIVPAELAAKLHEPLRRHFRDDPSVEVIVERRRRERRGEERRSGGDAGIAFVESRAADSRAIHNAAGRRVGERRSSVVSVDPPALPRKARPYADRLGFVERLGPSDEHVEDLDTARLVTRVQAGDRDAQAVLYLRYFDRVYRYLRVAFKDPHEAEDGVQEVFTDVLIALPRYELRGQPFRVWLFVVVRNHALTVLQKRSRVDLSDPGELDRRRERDGLAGVPELAALRWVSDDDLVFLLERLPIAQRQVLMLRYMLDLTHKQIAVVLDRSPEDVRVLNHRALRFLRDRLDALDRGPKPSSRALMRRGIPQATVLRARRFALMRY